LHSSRREFLAAAAATAAGFAPLAAEAAKIARGVFANGDRPLVAFPQKRPLMVLTPRPPQLETPFEIFDEGVLTPNDAFYVRWHLSGIPTTVDGAKHRIKVGGLVDHPLSLSVADLKKYEAVEVIAVNQCSGNSRGFFGPRVAGGQWQNGAMGNARWKGVRLQDILTKAGVQAGAKQVQFNGLEGPVFPETPDFKKSLDVAMATSNPDIIVAYEMNGEPLPLLNGYPVRLVVPGWFATYWVKMLNEITVLDHVDDNFWMKTAYRIPATPNANVLPTDKGYATIPINRMVVRSFITNLKDGASLKAGNHIIRGIAFDGGSGIRAVQLSSDGGATWSNALLEADNGPYSFRRWHTYITVQAGTQMTLACRAQASDGSMQVAMPIWNASGYQRNSIETYKVSVA
jgi:DMSO/TMAO reductase YedYZ molybdopterin-dependent catalytic subunit